MKKIIIKTIYIALGTVLLGFIAITSDVVTIFDIDVKSYIINNAMHLGLLYLIIILAIYSFLISKKLIEVEEENRRMLANTDVNVLEENIKKLNSDLNIKNEMIKKVQVTANSLASELDSYKNKNEYFDSQLRFKQIDNVRIIIDRIEDIETILFEISRYDKVKEKHKSSFLSIKSEYLKLITTFETYYLKYLEDTKNSSKRSLKYIFECSSIVDVIDKIQNENVVNTYKTYNLNEKNIKKFISYFKDPLTKYLAILEYDQ